MKTKDVEKILKRKLVEGVRLVDQVTPAEFAQISFETAIETYITTELNRISRTGTDEEIENRVRETWQKVLKECGGDYEKAIQRCV